MNDEIKHKLRAASIHLLISFLIFLVILYYILFDWYPEPFFTAQGGWQGIQLMAFVDLVLGPSLTLIVFNHLKKKKEIMFDLSIIAVVQIAALIWGGYMVYSQRPVALVFWTDAFYTVTSDDYAEQGIENPDFSRYSKHKPPLIYSRPLLTKLDLENFSALSKRSIPVYAHTAFYESIEENLKDIFSNQVNIVEVMANNTEMKTQIDRIAKGEIESYKYVALKAKYHNMILIMNENGGIIGEVKAPYLEETDM